MSMTAAAAGIGAALTSAGGSIASALQSERAVKRQIEWERERATHAHQWEVEDLKAAGLNPILSVDGSGATTGGISAPVPDTSGLGNAGAALAGAIESMTNTALTSAQIGKTGAETNNITADTLNKQETAKLIAQQTINEQLKSGLITAQTAQVELKNLQQKFENEHREATYWNDFINTATSSAKNITGASADILDLFLPKKQVEKAFKYIRANNKLNYF